MPTFFFRHEDLRKIAPPMANGDIKVVFKEVGDAAQHLLQMLYDRYALGWDTSKGLCGREADEAGIIVEGHI